jgi:hypothetical protein
MSHTIVAHLLPVAVASREHWFKAWVDDNGVVPVMWLWVSRLLRADSPTLEPVLAWLGAFSVRAEHVRYQEDPGYMFGEVAVVKLSLYPAEFFPGADVTSELQLALDGGERDYPGFGGEPRKPID